MGRMTRENREPSIWFMPWRWPLKFQFLAAAVLIILWLTTMFVISQFEIFEEI